MRIYKLITIISLSSLFVVSNASAAVPQSRWAYETSSGMPSVYTPLFVPNVDAPVGSSWNEDRGSGDSPPQSGPHTGVDQSVTNQPVGTMYTTARILREEDRGSAGGKALTIRYYNSSAGKTFYSLYYHLSAFSTNFPENSTPAVSDQIATTGNTGGVPYHLHYELLDSITADVGTVNYDSRVGVNPANYVTGGPSSSTIAKFNVFKNISNSSRTLYVDAWDSNTSPNIFNYVKVYYKINGSSTWNSADMSRVSGTSYGYNYTFPSSASYVDYFIIGKRKSTGDRWSVYPVKIYDTGESSSGVDTSANTYDTVRINF
jgi:hypothetical protein